jgi:general stress protein YciG
MYSHQDIEQLTDNRDIQTSQDASKSITVREAGRRGGQTTLKNQGNDFFRRIGKKGGKRTAELYRDLLSEFGKKGGRPRRPTLSEYMEEEDR